MTRVMTIRDDGTHREEILVVKRDISTGELKYALANGPTKITLKRLLQDWSRRHTIEECFQRGKSDLGMDHYEVRSWVGWHHHMTMMMLAMCFLEKERICKTRSFSPSDGFYPRLAHGRNDPTSSPRSGRIIEAGETTNEKDCRCEVLSCQNTKNITFTYNRPSQTMVN